MRDAFENELMYVVTWIDGKSNFADEFTQTNDGLSEKLNSML